jgi:hypothetical protein
MDVIAAYREAGTLRGAAQIAGTTHKTVKRVIARHEAGGGLGAVPVSWTMEAEGDGLVVQPRCHGRHFDQCMFACGPACAGRAAPRQSPALAPGPAPRSGAA